MYQRLLNEWLKTEEGATLFNKHKRDIDLLSGFASWLEGRPTPLAVDGAYCSCKKPYMYIDRICQSCGLPHAPRH